MNTGNGRKKRSANTILDYDRLETIFSELEKQPNNVCENQNGAKGLQRYLSERAADLLYYIMNYS